MNNSPLRILLTDDDLGDRIVFAEICMEMELETTVQLLKKWVELMDYLNKKDVLPPDLLFLDLNMPKKMA